MWTQNRQFQWYHVGSFIYPLVPAMAATLLERSGFDVIWNDCIAQQLDMETFLNTVDEENLDLIAFEAKTPIMKRLWSLYKDLKARGTRAKLALFWGPCHRFAGRVIRTIPGRLRDYRRKLSFVSAWIGQTNERRRGNSSGHMVSGAKRDSKHRGVSAELRFKRTSVRQEKPYHGPSVWREIVGYPWETKKHALRTVKLAKALMAQGAAEMLQATTLVPYPGTPLYEYALERGLFRFGATDYERFDMREPVLTTPDMTAEEVMNMCQGVYRSFLTPRFVLRRLMKTHSWEDIDYLVRGAKAVIGHLKDFSKGNGHSLR
jgi:hypothetical protein